MPAPNSQLPSVEMKLALRRINLILSKHDKSAKIRKIIAEINSMELQWECGNLNDILYVNDHLRIKMLALLDKSGKQEMLCKDLFVSLLMLTNYWPLNNSRFNHSDGTYEFECPLSGTLIEDEKRLLLPTGTQINLQLLPRYLTEFADDLHKLKDPFSTHKIGFRCATYLAAMNTAVMGAYLNSPSYSTYVSERLGHGSDFGSCFGALASGLTMGVVILLIQIALPVSIAIGMIVGCAMMLPFATFFGGLFGETFISKRLEKEKESLLNPDVSLRVEFEENLAAVRREALDEVADNVLVSGVSEFSEQVVVPSSTVIIAKQLAPLVQPDGIAMSEQEHKAVREVWIKNLEQKVRKSAVNSMLPIEAEAKSGFAP